MKTLKIICCILACCCVAAAIPIGIWCDVIYVVLDIAVAIFFGFGMYFFKKKSDPVVPHKDFMDDDPAPTDRDDDHRTTL